MIRPPTVLSRWPRSPPPLLLFARVVDAGCFLAWILCNLYGSHVVRRDARSLGHPCHSGRCLGCSPNGTSAKKYMRVLTRVKQKDCSLFQQLSVPCLFSVPSDATWPNRQKSSTSPLHLGPYFLRKYKDCSPSRLETEPNPDVANRLWFCVLRKALRR